MKSGGIDYSELHNWIRYERRSHSGSRWFDLDDREISDDERKMMLEALHETSGFKEYPFQDTVNCVGGAASREGKSFDESLLSYYVLYVESEPSR